VATSAEEEAELGPADDDPTVVVVEEDEVEVVVEARGM
jgi:hypothetical protein